MARMCKELLSQLQGNSDRGLQHFCGHYQHVLPSCQARSPRYLEMLCIVSGACVPSFVSSPALNASTIITSLNLSEVADAGRVEHITSWARCATVVGILAAAKIVLTEIQARNRKPLWPKMIQPHSGMEKTPRNDEFYGSSGTPPSSW